MLRVPRDTTLLFPRTLLLPLLIPSCLYPMGAASCPPPPLPFLPPAPHRFWCNNGRYNNNNIIIRTLDFRAGRRENKNAIETSENGERSRFVRVRHTPCVPTVVAVHMLSGVAFVYVRKNMILLRCTPCRWARKLRLHTEPLRFILIIFYTNALRVKYAAFVRGGVILLWPPYSSLQYYRDMIWRRVHAI